MSINKLLLSGAAVALLAGCSKSIEKENRIFTVQSNSALAALSARENPENFALLSTTDIGESGAAEISAYDKKSRKLFVVNNTAGNNRIDVLDFSDPAHPLPLTSIPVSPYGGMVNSVAAHDGFVAAAIEAIPKTAAGKVVVFSTANYAEIKVIGVGALPDDVKYSPDGKLIISANEGEPSPDYTNDPLGTISIISVKDNYAVVTLDFASFTAMEVSLKSRGLRKFGPGASFAQDMEPEFVTISSDSRTAWVTLQENNSIAKVDLRNKRIEEIFPLGFKNYNLAGNSIDPCDRPLGTIAFNNWPVYGMYQPDGIAVLESKTKEGEDDNDEFAAKDGNRIPYLFTANEGDARDYAAFVEEVRVGAASVVLSPSVFPTAASLKLSPNLGRLTITNTLGKTGNGNEYNALYSFGARSFSVWNGNTGAQLYDSKNTLEQKVVQAGMYDDDRSDNKGVEPEGIAIGQVGKKMLAFVGLERADAVAIYDVTDPTQPRFLQLLATGDAPEGVLFIPAKDSPNKRSLLLVSSENDGVVKVYMPGLF